MKKKVGGISSQRTSSPRTSSPQTPRTTRDDGGQRSETASIQDGYYRSQDEVDAAFAKRFARERAKWEQEQLMRQQEQDTADEQDVLDEQNAPDDSANAEVETDEETQAWIDDVVAEAEVIAEYAPDFDLEEELDDNPLFAMMLAEGEPLEKVYAYFYPEYAEQRIIDEVERHISDRIRSRSAMPAHISNSIGQAGTDARRLSDAQIREIDKRVRGGERIRF